MMIIIIIYLLLLYFSIEALNQVAKVKPLWLGEGAFGYNPVTMPLTILYT